MVPPLLQASIFIFVPPPSPYLLSLWRKGNAPYEVYALSSFFHIQNNRKQESISLSLSLSPCLRIYQNQQALVLDFPCSLFFVGRMVRASSSLLALLKMGMWTFFGESAFLEAEQPLLLRRTVFVLFWVCHSLHTNAQLHSPTPSRKPTISPKKRTKERVLEILALKERFPTSESALKMT